ncbi:hypothetical protein EOD42_02245 [Rhodovarius crocodyli]|uniref:Uncharacterized protein n=1 Tax=Rhodovarius crocodyli TaxID=1979269 RepID=A0A437MMV1_9PROT|nr:hypothetical protein [Rhodovarius crocodyli]RVT98952.1 hypothetical protein EOD42_02245 [Rhodovarius crocodyli]
MKGLNGGRPGPILAPMRALPFLLMLLMPGLAPVGASAQAWPNDGGLGRDSFRGAVGAFDRFAADDNPRTSGEEAREAVGGILGAAREWVERQTDKIGERDRDVAPYFNLRRDWEGDLIRRR